MDEHQRTAYPLVLPATAEAPGLARRHLAGLGGELSDDTLELAELLTSELVTNAVRYGLGTVRLTVEQTGTRIRVGVGDRNPEFPHPSVPDPTAERGRGLYLLERLASRWGCSAAGEPRGKTVWFELG